MRASSRALRLALGLVLCATAACGSLAQHGAQGEQIVDEKHQKAGRRALLESNKLLPSWHPNPEHVAMVKKHLHSAVHTGSDAYQQAAKAVGMSLKRLPTLPQGVKGMLAQKETAGETSSLKASVEEASEAAQEKMEEVVDAAADATAKVAVELGLVDASPPPAPGALQTVVHGLEAAVGLAPPRADPEPQNPVRATVGNFRHKVVPAVEAAVEDSLGQAQTELSAAAGVMEKKVGDLKEAVGLESSSKDDGVGPDEATSSAPKEAPAEAPADSTTGEPGFGSMVSGVLKRAKGSLRDGGTTLKDLANRAEGTLRKIATNLTDAYNAPMRDRLDDSAAHETQARAQLEERQSFLAELEEAKQYIKGSRKLALL